MWAEHGDFKGIVQTCWSMPVKGCLIYQIITRLRHMKEQFKQLHGEYFKGIVDRVQTLHIKLMQVQEELSEDPSSS